MYIFVDFNNRCTKGVSCLTNKGASYINLVSGLGDLKNKLLLLLLLNMVFGLVTTN